MVYGNFGTGHLERETVNNENDPNKEFFEKKNLVPATFSRETDQNLLRCLICRKAQYTYYGNTKETERICALCEVILERAKKRGLISGVKEIKYVEKTAREPKQKIVEKIVYKDRIIEKLVEKIVYKDRVVEKPVEKVVYRNKIVERQSRPIYVETVKHICAECKSPFNPTVTNQRYCSAHCFGKATYDRFGSNQKFVISLKSKIKKLEILLQKKEKIIDALCIMESAPTVGKVKITERLKEKNIRITTRNKRIKQLEEEVYELRKEVENKKPYSTEGMYTI